MTLGFEVQREVNDILCASTVLNRCTDHKSSLNASALQRCIYPCIYANHLSSAFINDSCKITMIKMINIYKYVVSQYFFIWILVAHLTKNGESNYCGMKRMVLIFVRVLLL